MNPLTSAYQNSFGIPPFNRIKNEHFKPALQEGMEVQNKHIQEIITNPNVPDFQNTIEAFERSGDLLQKVKNVFFNFTLALTDKELQDIANEMVPQLSLHWDNIKLDEKLFFRIRQVWENRKLYELNPEEQMLLKKTYLLFTHNGANLSEGDKEKLKILNEKEATLSLTVGKNILAENNNFQLVIDNQKDLKGLSQTQIDQAAMTASLGGMEGKWIFTLHQSSAIPFLQYADNRELRKQLWEAYQSKGATGGENDNRKIISQLVNIRRKKANILGYRHHTDYILEDAMAKSYDQVKALLDQLWKPALHKAKEERDAMQAYIDSSNQKIKLAPYDWRYFAEKIRIQNFDLDMNELRPYFSLDGVLAGVFMVADRLFGLKFTRLYDVPVYHPDVVVYEVKEADESPVGILFIDFYMRESKQGGAWMTKFRAQHRSNGKRISPIISVVCNYSKPTEQQPTLLDLEDVTTLFHEFGHALHGLLSDVTYQSLSGTAVPRDFVELPSQIMENWALEPSVMKEYAVHYQTQEVIPDKLLEKIKLTGTFDQGFSKTEYLAASYLDLQYHTLESEFNMDIDEFEKEILTSIGLIEEIIPRYRSSYFNHVFSGGYSSNYYSYVWAAVLDADAFENFKESELYDKKEAISFRTNILEKGGSEEPDKMFRTFKGKDAEIKPLLKRHGLS